MSNRHMHTKEFSYKYAASIITAVSVGEKGATVSVKTKDGSVFDTNWPLDAFFNKGPSVGKWLVDGHFGERFVVSESELSKLGDEVTDSSHSQDGCCKFSAPNYAGRTVPQLRQLHKDLIDEYMNNRDIEWFSEQSRLIDAATQVAYSKGRY